jgi:DNA-binding XRE family transcriptional regulator
MLTNMQNEILETIKQIETEKQTARRVPCYALCYEICRRLNVPKTVLLQELKAMQAAGVVFVGNTINDNYILLCPIEKRL